MKKTAPVAASAAAAAAPEEPLSKKAKERRLGGEEQAARRRTVADISRLTEKQLKQPPQEAHHRVHLAWALIHLDRIAAHAAASNHAALPWFSAFTRARRALLQAIAALYDEP